MMTNHAVVNTLNAGLVLRYFVSAALRTMSNFVTISGFVNATKEDNTDELMRDLVNRGFNVVPGFGAYKGEREASLFVLPPQLDGKFSEQDMRELHRLAQWYRQESFLLANDEGYNFVYTDGRREKVGDALAMGEHVTLLDFHSNFAGVMFAVI